MSVLRVYVEKKPEFCVEAEAIFYELKHIFAIESLKKLRLINRYDVEGLGSDYIDEAVRTVLSEPQTDIHFDELPDDYDFLVGTEFLPGQYDQRADSCAQCLQMLSGGERPLVRSAKIYLFYGALTQTDRDVIKRHLINPVESMEASLELPDTLAVEHPAPEAVAVLEGFTKLTDDEIPQFRQKIGAAMDDNDLIFCRDYFLEQGRDPTVAELRVIDTYWSDHCRHTTFLTHLEDIKIDNETVRQAFDNYRSIKKDLGRESRPVTLMDLATIGARKLKKDGLLKALDESEEINACSVKIKVDEDGSEQDWLLMFKNETHNHPTEIEPFGGAATCIGGAIRDPLSGRSYVYQAMRVTGSGDPTTAVSETLPGKLPQREITTKAAHGYSSYGNQIGLATGLVKEIYHPGYIAKRLETGAVLGAAPAKNVIREKPAAGDVVILLGGRTGRDGCGGATGSSKSHSQESLATCGAEVQKGNAPEERKIQRLFRDCNVTRLIKRCNDFGAGGVSVAVGELADGLRINLNAVPKKYSGLDGTELAISESQERMAVVVSSENAQRFIELANSENLEATVIAEVTDSAHMEMYLDGRKIVDISREFLNTNGAAKRACASVQESQDKSDGGYNLPKQLKNALGSQSGNLERFFSALVSDLNICSQRGLTEQFDSTIGAATVLMPLGGAYQMTPQQTMAAKLPVMGSGTNTCSLMTFAFYPYVSQANPYIGAYLAVAASAAKIIAAGGSLSACWLSFQEYFERLGNDPDKWGKPLSALLGALQAQLDLGIAAIGGKDSMSGTFENLDVPPTLISFAVSTAKTSNIVSGEFKQIGSEVILMAPEYTDEGLPVSKSLVSIYEQVEKLIDADKVLAAYVVESGGIAEAIFKMTLGNHIGFEFSEQVINTECLTKHLIGSIILELAEPVEQTGTGILLGETTPDFNIVMGDETISCIKLQEMFEKTLEPVFPTRPVSEDKLYLPQSGTKYEDEEQNATANVKAKATVLLNTKPRVLIPVFPGTNCEYDTARAFTQAGADSEIFVIKNLTSADIEQSVSALSEAIGHAQIVALPGGFSGGDEPEGSAKFIISLFKNPRIKDAVAELLGSRDGLMCGICNGFQALIKLGLVPYGEIIQTDASSPTLTFNTIGRHQSKLVRTRVLSNKSPWLINSQPGDIHTVAISHGEGRFTAPYALIDKLAINGQIATQYVDLEGNPTMDTRFNPNGSVFAVEGITSPDGRVFGKMGHSERAGDDVFINVPGDKNQGIFNAAVKYYQL